MPQILSWTLISSTRPRTCPNLPPLSLTLDVATDPFHASVRSAVRGTFLLLPLLLPLVLVLTLPRRPTQTQPSMSHQIHQRTRYYHVIPSISCRSHLGFDVGAFAPNKRRCSVDQRPGAASNQLHTNQNRAKRTSSILMPRPRHVHTLGNEKSCWCPQHRVLLHPRERM